MRKLSKTLVGLAVAAHLAAAPLAVSTHAYALAGNITLPAPYVSRALDAVLIPIDQTVRTAFGLSSSDNGVLVLAVEPGGVADSYGIVAGDVISEIRGHRVLSPIDVDTVVYYWINLGTYDFLIDYYRDGARASTTSNITLELYEAVIDIASIATWSSWSYETSFSYSEFYSEYSETITESYESSETLIEETATSEEFADDIADDETASDDGADDGDADDDGISDDEDTDDDGDGIDDADDTDDDGDGIDDADDTGDDGADDEGDDAGDDDGGDDEADGGDDSDDGDDAGDDGDDGGDDEGGDDDGGDE